MTHYKRFATYLLKIECKQVENKSAPAQVRPQTTTKLARKIIQLAALVKLRSSLLPSLRSADLFSNVFNNSAESDFFQQEFIFFTKLI